jgi:hypothetical protein
VTVCRRYDYEFLAILHAAMRHPTQGKGQRGHWFQFPFNRGMLCPKGVNRYWRKSRGKPPAIPWEGWTHFVGGATT